MRLYTIQGARHWAEARNLGVLTGGPFDHHVDPEWRHAYRWMRAQMKARLPWFSGDFPVWAWPESQLSEWSAYQGWGEFGEKMVLLEFEVPDTRTLVSDFFGWHFTLNGTLLCNENEESQEADKEASWLQIFNPPEGADWSGDTVQVCVDRVFPGEVYSVTPFVVPEDPVSSHYFDGKVASIEHVG